MGELYVPDHVRQSMEAERAERAATEAALQAQQHQDEAQAILAVWLRKAFEDGFEVALRTPARLLPGLNMDATFQRWYEAHTEPEDRPVTE